MLGLSTYSTLGIGLAVQLRNQFSGPAAAVVTSMGQMRAAQQQLMANQVSTLRNTSALAAGVGILLTAGIGKAITEGAKFEQTLQTIKAVAGVTGISLKQLRDQAINLSEAYPIRSDKILEGSLVLAKAGYTGDNILKMNKAIIDLSTATGFDVGGEGGIAQGMATILSAFQLSAEKAPHIADVLTTTLNRTKADFKDLMEFITYSGASMHKLGIPMEEGMAMVGELVQYGIPSSVAGTTTRQLLDRLPKLLERPTKTQNKIMQSLGLTKADFAEVKNGMVVMKPTEEWLKNLYGRFKDINDVFKKSDMLTALFGLRAQSSVIPLMLSTQPNKQGIITFGDLVKANMTEVGVAATTANEKQQNLIDNLTKLKDAWFNFKVEWEQTIAPILTPMVSMLRYMLIGIRSLNSTGIGKTFLIMTTAGVVIGTFAAVVTAAVSSIVLAINILRGSTVALAAGGGGLRGIGGLAAEAGMMSGGAKAVGGATSVGRGFGSLLSMLGLGGARASRLSALETARGMGLRMNAAGKWIEASTGRFVSTEGLASIGLLGKGAEGAGFLANAGKIANLTGLWKGSGLLGKAGLIGTGIGMGVDAYNHKYGSAIGTGLGAGIGALLGFGVPGAILGGMAGGWIGSLFDKDSGSTQVKMPGSTPPMSANTYNEPGYGNNGLYKLSKKDTIVNIFLDGKQAMSKIINDGQQDDIHQYIGL